MNREIKFRGKSDWGKWHFGFYHKDKDGSYILTETDVYYVLPHSIGQFTGLHDKNGVEIYEGDLVKFDYPEIFKHTYFGVIGVNKYNQWCIHMPHEDVEKYGIEKGEFHICYAVKYGEVIGNIHDNPELLKTEKP